MRDVEYTLERRVGTLRAITRTGDDRGQGTIGQSVVWNWAGIIVSGVVSFVTMPIMIHRLGSFYYGIWILLNAFVGYYGLLDIGIADSLRRFTSRFHGANDPDALHQVV